MADGPTNTCVWFEIPCTDLEASRTFYEAVLGTEMAPSDEADNPMIAFTSMADEGVSGHLYPGAPAARGAGPTIHLAVKGALEDAMGRVAAAGGAVVSEILDIPVGRLVYCEDLDGNSFGLFSA